MPRGARRETLPAGWWVIAVFVAVSALLVHAGVKDGDWRGVAVSEAQVVVVALVTYLGLR